jgi:hypothetical protein
MDVNSSQKWDSDYQNDSDVLTDEMSAVFDSLLEFLPFTHPAIPPRCGFEELLVFQETKQGE